MIDNRTRGGMSNAVATVFAIQRSLLSNLAWLRGSGLGSDLGRQPGEKRLDGCSLGLLSRHDGSIRSCLNRMR